MSRSRTPLLLLILGLVAPLGVQAGLPDVEEQSRVLGKWLEDFEAQNEKLMEEVETFADQLESEYEQLKAHGQDRENFSEDVRDRTLKLIEGEEIEQLEALDGIEALGEGGQLLALVAARGSEHMAVRRRGIDAAVAMGREGYPVIWRGFKSASTDDQLYALEKLSDDPTGHYRLLLVLVDEAETEALAALIDIGAYIGGDDGLRLAMIAAGEDDEEEMLAYALAGVAGTFGEDSELMLLQWMCRSDNPIFHVEAVKAVRDRAENRERGLVVVLAALESTDPEIRTEAVRSAKQIGGSAAEAMISRALEDPNGYLRWVAEKVVEEE